MINKNKEKGDANAVIKIGLDFFVILRLIKYVQVVPISNRTKMSNNLPMPCITFAAPTQTRAMRAEGTKFVSIAINVFIYSPLTTELTVLDYVPYRFSIM